jgi:hypothetical protein
MMLDLAIMSDELPKWIRIGPPTMKYFYQLASVEPIVYRGTRRAEGWEMHPRGECLWLFQRGPLWVAAHAPRNAARVEQVLSSSQVMFATLGNPLEEGVHNWFAAYGFCRTEHAEPDSVPLQIH